MARSSLLPCLHLSVIGLKRSTGFLVVFLLVVTPAYGQLNCSSLVLKPQNDSRLYMNVLKEGYVQFNGTLLTNSSVQGQQYLSDLQDQGTLDSFAFGNETKEFMFTSEAVGVVEVASDGFCANISLPLGSPVDLENGKVEYQHQVVDGNTITIARFWCDPGYKLNLSEVQAFVPSGIRWSWNGTTEALCEAKPFNSSQGLDDILPTPMSQSQRVLASLASLIVLIPILVVVVVLVLLYCCKRGKCKKSHSKPPLGRGADSVTTDERIVMEAAGSVAEQSSDEADGPIHHPPRDKSRVASGPPPPPPSGTQSGPPPPPSRTQSGPPPPPSRTQSGPPPPPSRTQSGPPPPPSRTQSGPPPPPSRTQSGPPPPPSRTQSGPPPPPSRTQSGPPPPPSRTQSGPPPPPSRTQSGPPPPPSRTQSRPPPRPSGVRHRTVKAVKYRPLPSSEDDTDSSDSRAAGPYHGDNPDYGPSSTTLIPFLSPSCPTVHHHGVIELENGIVKCKPGDSAPPPTVGQASELGHTTLGSPHSKRCVKSKDMMLKYMEQLGGEESAQELIPVSEQVQQYMHSRTVDCENETVTELVVDMEQLDKEKNEKKVAKTTHEFNSSEETSDPDDCNFLGMPENDFFLSKGRFKRWGEGWWPALALVLMVVLAVYVSLSDNQHGLAPTVQLLPLRGKYWWFDRIIFCGSFFWSVRQRADSDPVQFDFSVLNLLNVCSWSYLISVLFIFVPWLAM